MGGEEKGDHLREGERGERRREEGRERGKEAGRKGTMNH